MHLPQHKSRPRKTELALEMKSYLDFHRVSWSWRPTLTNGSDVNYGPRRGVGEVGGTSPTPRKYVFTSLPLVSVRRYGRVTRWKWRQNFISSASSVPLVHDLCCAKMHLTNVSLSIEAKFWRRLTCSSASAPASPRTAAAGGRSRRRPAWPARPPPAEASSPLRPRPRRPGPKHNAPESVHH